MSRPKRNLFCDRVAHIYSRTLPEIIFTNDDREEFSTLFRTFTQKNKYVIYYYSILSNHFHTQTQCTKEVNCSHQPKVLKQQMTKAFNARHHRRGTIWDGRYDDVTIASEDHFWTNELYLACNQTRAGIVSSPIEERFSSFAAYCRGVDDGITTLPPQYWELAETSKGRQEAFQEMVLESLAVYQDVDAFARSEEGRTFQRINPRWAQDLLKLEEYERKHLEKRRDEQAIVLVLSKAPQDDPPAENIEEMIEDAVADPSSQNGDRDTVMVTEEERDELHRNGVPDRVIRLFYAPKDVILDMVRKEYRIYRLHVPPPARE